MLKIMLVIILILFVWSFFIEPNMLVVKHYKIEALDGMRIVFVSDFHISKYEKKRLKRVVKLINKVEKQFLFEENARSIVIEPTLPNIIRKQRIRHDMIPSVGVSPTERPTVAMADTVSKSASRKAIPSMRDMRTAPPQESSKYSRCSGSSRFT